MAKATTFARTVRKTIKTEEPGYVELNLTPVEASVLAQLLNHVGGNPAKDCPRAAIDDIATALRAVGVTGTVHDMRGSGGAIYFE